MTEPDKATTYLPLSPPVFEILLALVDTQRHGYAIMGAVRERTAGRLELLPGTLYRALSRLERSGLVEISEHRPDPVLDDQRRRYYRLTELGRSVLEAEVARLADLVAAAKDKDVVARPQVP